MSIGKSSIARAVGATQKDAIKEAPKKKSLELLSVETDLIKHAKGYTKNSKLTSDSDLVSSVKEKGIIVPLLVSVTANGKFYLLDGSLRLDAAKLLGKKTVPAIALSVENSEEASSLYKELRAASKTKETKPAVQKSENKKDQSVKRSVRELPYYLL